MRPDLLCEVYTDKDKLTRWRMKKRSGDGTSNVIYSSDETFKNAKEAIKWIKEFFPGKLDIRTIV